MCGRGEGSVCVAGAFAVCLGKGGGGDRVEWRCVCVFVGGGSVRGKGECEGGGEEGEAQNMYVGGGGKALVWYSHHLYHQLACMPFKSFVSKPAVSEALGAFANSDCLHPNKGVCGKGGVHGLCGIVCALVGQDNS